MLSIGVRDSTLRPLAGPGTNRSLIQTVLVVDLLTNDFNGARGEELEA